MFRKLIVGIGVLISVMTIAAIVVVVWPQVLPPAVPNPWASLVVQPLRNGVYWVQGGVSNTGFIVGNKGVIVIDAQMFSVTAKHVLAKIAKITTAPVNMVILTHSDPDHINGLPAYPLGIAIIAQENANSDILAALADPHPDFSAPPKAVRDYLPTHLVRDKEELVFDDVRMVLLHYGPAHTDGDLIVYLPVQKVVFAGDLLTPSVGPYPGIHPRKHGTSLGWIHSVSEMLALDADLFVSGHGEPQTRNQVQVRLQAAEQRRARIKTLVDEHKSLDEVKAALRDLPPSGVARLFPTYTETTYEELSIGQGDVPH